MDTTITDTDDDQQKNDDQASQNEQPIQWVVWLDSYLPDYSQEMMDDTIIITRESLKIEGFFIYIRMASVSSRRFDLL
jgi:hypothetical protein